MTESALVRRPPSSMGRRRNHSGRRRSCGKPSSGTAVSTRFTRLALADPGLTARPGDVRCGYRAHRAAVRRGKQLNDDPLRRRSDNRAPGGQAARPAVTARAVSDRPATAAGDPPRRGLSGQLDGRICRADVLRDTKPSRPTRRSRHPRSVARAEPTRTSDDQDRPTRKCRRTAGHRQGDRLEDLDRAVQERDGISRVPTPQTPYRLEINVEPTFSPLNYGQPDARQLGAQVDIRAS